MYHDRKIIRDGAVPEWLIASAKNHLKQCQGMNPPRGIWCHITGTDLVRDGDGQIYVLEDNLRCPSGVSYVLENREIMKRTFPQSFDGFSILPVENYPDKLLEMLIHIARGVRDPNVVVLTPGVYNSAYLSTARRRMGWKRCRAPILVSKATFSCGPTAWSVDVISRRSTTSLDETFRADSRWRAGFNGSLSGWPRRLANAPGTGVADDKAIYAFVPQMIKYYLGEEMILPNVPSFVCGDEQQCEHVLANMDKLVIKPANESGGYGILLGPKASHAERERHKDLIRANPRNYIAQPMLAAVARADDHRDHFEGRRRSAAIHPLRQGNLRAPRWADARGFAEGIARCELVTRRRQQGHLGLAGRLSAQRETSQATTGGGERMTTCSQAGAWERVTQPRTAAQGGGASRRAFPGRSLGTRSVREPGNERVTGGGPCLVGWRIRSSG
jgi:uncharacterized circularly permuted ATP-grasp superfamily protein